MRTNTTVTIAGRTFPALRVYDAADLAECRRQAEYVVCCSAQWTARLPAGESATVISVVSHREDCVCHGPFSVRLGASVGLAPLTLAEREQWDAQTVESHNLTEAEVPAVIDAWMAELMEEAR